MIKVKIVGTMVCNAEVIGKDVDLLDEYNNAFAKVEVREYADGKGGKLRQIKIEAIEDHIQVELKGVESVKEVQ